MTQILLCKRGGHNNACLMPETQEAHEFLIRFREGETVRADIRKVRNPKQHRLFFALLKKCFEQQSAYPTQESLRAALLVGIGHCDIIKGISGTEIAVPKSMSFGNMAQDEFNELFQAFVKLICERIIPGVDSEAFANEIYEMVK